MTCFKATGMKHIIYNIPAVTLELRLTVDLLPCEGAFYGSWITLKAASVLTSETVLESHEVQVFQNWSILYNM